MLELLRPIFRGDWARYGECLRLRDTAPAQPSIARWLSDPANVNTALMRHAERIEGTRQPKAVASDWVLHYLTALLPPIVALSSLLKYRVPADWCDMAVTLDEHGAPARFSISGLGTALPSSTAATRYDTLVWQHLEPLVLVMARHTRVPIRTLRGNVHRTLLGIFKRALERISHDPQHLSALIDDRRQLLESPAWPDGRRNPLFLRQRQVCTRRAGGASCLTLHASCCLAYRLPRQRRCGACPLDPQHITRK
jgi:ferric iron reductase protein FhuF